jgi:2,3-bisphosphoglycerate-independent phosphoglycerate mutase
MPSSRLPDDVVIHGQGGRIVLLVLDGVGGLPHPETGLTELETARIPNLDALAAESSLGMLLPVAPGITPGSGPGHLALFGYDPVECFIGRGALSALGVGFELVPGDVAVRLNLATLDAQGRVTDRRAGRPSDDEGRRIVEALREGVSLDGGADFFMLHEKEHRAVLVLRGDDLGGGVRETDPQQTGVAPHPPEALDVESERTARLMTLFLEQARELLAGEERVTGLLARGFARFEGFPSLEERFGVRGVAHARYPMYRGVARLVGMAVSQVPTDEAKVFESVERHFADFDFHFLHRKAADARGEDGDFDAKVAAIEEVDALVPRLTALGPDVLIVTGDHCTPATLRAHSWHHVPVLIRSAWCRPTGDEFSERACRGGDLGTLEARHLMSLALAHAGRLEKFGA